MPLDTYESIFDQFPPVSPDAWKQKIMQDLKEVPFETLCWHSGEEIEVLPFYTNENNKEFQLSVPLKNPEGWLITERITVVDIATANQLALDALQMGATAILFDLNHKAFSNDKAAALVTKIFFDAATVYFENYLPDNKELLESIIPGSCPNKIIIQRRPALTDELADALWEGTRQIHSYVEVPAVFHFYISTNYFFEIARLRAFRWLWKQVCDLHKIPFRVFIFSETDVKEHDPKDEYTNIMRNTTEAMSAILGGSDVLIINSHDAAQENSGFGKRIARNIHHILLHESYFTGVEDPAKGSYYMEYLTFQMAKKAWGKFMPA